MRTCYVWKKFLKGGAYHGKQGQKSKNQCDFYERNGYRIGRSPCGRWCLLYFSDRETSNGNKITAGSLDLTNVIEGTYTSQNNVKGSITENEQDDGLNDSVVFDKIAPGDSGSITWTLKNIGNIRGFLAITATVEGDTNGTTEPEQEAIGENSNTDLNLMDLLGVRLAITTPTQAATYILGDHSYYVPLSQLKAKLDDQKNLQLDPDKTYVYKLEWSLPPDVKTAGDDGKFGTEDDVQINDNILQTDTSTIDMTFYLDQTQDQAH